MRKVILICFMFLISISLVFGLCEEGQIDINTATLVELDKIYGVGPVKAQAIINTRPFVSVNELIKVPGIGELTLDKILDQGLVCVENEVIKEEIAEEEVLGGNGGASDFARDEEELNERGQELEGGSEQTLTPQVIKLNTPKDIKSEDNIEGLDKADYAKYGFIVFCILIGVLLILRNKKRQKYKD